MRTIGLLGGMSWESTELYYRVINERVRERLGGFSSARIVMISVDFAEIERMQVAGDWATAGEALATDARRLEATGADLIVLCTNTMHRVADAIEAAVSVPLLHIADVAAQAVTSAGVRTIGLVGTRFTMEQPFYIERLAAAGLEVLVPEGDDRTTVHDIIYSELVRGVVTAESRAAYRAVIDDLVQRGAEGIVLGCTEIELLVTRHDSAVPVFATTRLHARTAADWAIAESADVGSAGLESA